MTNFYLFANIGLFQFLLNQFGLQRWSVTANSESDQFLTPSDFEEAIRLLNSKASLDFRAPAFKSKSIVCGTSHMPENLLTPKTPTFIDSSCKSSKEICKPFDYRERVDLEKAKREMWKFRWPGAVVPYTLKHNFSANFKIAFAAALYLLSNNTCIEFEPFNDVQGTPHKRAMRVTTSKNPQQCSATVGGWLTMRPNVFMDETTCSEVRTITHELIHLLGLGHEHQRVDRGEYIEFWPEHLQNDSFIDFVIGSQYPDYFVNTPYNIDSLMHYPGLAGSKDGQPVLTVKKHRSKVIEGAYGPGPMPTLLDYAKINMHYDCGAKYPECRDLEFDCSALGFTTATNRCVNDLEWAEERCMKTCARCFLLGHEPWKACRKKRGTGRVCVDWHSHCKMWKQHDWCSSKHTESIRQFMNENCAKSCGRC